jgi:hypothetical protein
MRKTYWCCTKFADVIRGVDKPKAASLKEWKRWRAGAKKTFPVRYWLTENLLDSIQRTVYAPYDILCDIQSYLLNRFVDRSNAIVAERDKIAPGAHADYGDKILPCLFGGLVDFVEVDLAFRRIHYCAACGYSNKIERNIFSRNRCAQAGIDQLEEYIRDNSSNKWYAKETLDLYIWWVFQRPMRKEVHVDWCNTLVDEKQLIAYNESIDRDEKEDTEMLIRLIKIRSFLWA